MIGKQEHWQEDLFLAGPLSSLIPKDHILKRVDKMLDLSWLRDEVRDLYNEHQGRPGIDPEAAVRLMLAGLFQGIVHDRKLMREAQVNLAIRWFAGYRLHENLPHHSSLTRIRQRWGPQRFRRIFLKTVSLCADSGLINGETVHIDATLIRADVSWESLTEQHVGQVLEVNEDDNSAPSPKKGRPRKSPKKAKKISQTDPDATMTTSCNRFHLEPSFKQHTAVDDQAGVIVDVDITTGEVSEGGQLPDQIERIENNTGKQIQTLTADSGYAHPSNYAHLEKREIEGVIPPQNETKHPKRIPIRRFKYDAKHKIVRCPAGKTLHRSSKQKNGWLYRAKRCDCKSCPLQERCIPKTASSRTILIVNDYESLIRARRDRQRWSPEKKATYQRHRWRVEGVHGEAKKWHALGRAARRGLANVAIQVYLTAAIINLKRLAAFLRAFLGQYKGQITLQDLFWAIWEVKCWNERCVRNNRCMATIGC
ncbi:transposase [candidate division KSB1 bacterium]|nr:transposase [Phycisphaerae bacterium]NIS50185.1 transposase [Phycisphaerae bacterium]NIV92019.1 transposase [candidate division KSB1 bacterium]